MEFYTKRTKKSRSFVLIIVILFIIFSYMILMIFDKRVFPYVLQLGEMKAKSQTIKIINENSTKILNEEFRYDEIIVIEKDSEGKIVLIQSDSAKLNKIAAKMADECNKDLDKMKDETIPVPLGWITDKSLLYNAGPKIYVKIQPMGNMTIAYDSKFESAGINQTRHKIYLIAKAKVRMKMPLISKEMEINTQIPVSETIIIGDIPQVSMISEFGQKN